MSRTVTFEDEEFALYRGGGATAGLVDIYVQINVSEFDAADWSIREIGTRAYGASQQWETLNSDSHLYRAIADAVEEYEQDRVAGLIAEAFEPDPDYLRDMRENSTLNHFQQGVA